MTREEAIQYWVDFREEIDQFMDEYWTKEDMAEQKEATDMAIAALREQPQWIPVTERLPQETGEVCKVVNLLMDNGLVTAGWLNDITGLGYFLDSRSNFIRQAPLLSFTHWMPLPDLPEEEV